eukprot:1158084-Pelagomonas_calceolata.AAC.20
MTCVRKRQRGGSQGMHECFLENSSQVSSHSVPVSAAQSSHLQTRSPRSSAWTASAGLSAVRAAAGGQRCSPHCHCWLPPYH